MATLKEVGSHAVTGLKTAGKQLDALSHIATVAVYTGYPSRIGGEWKWFDLQTKDEFFSIRHTLKSERSILESFVDSLRPGDVFIDIGAHYGVYSYLALLEGASVVAIEASPDNLQYLGRRLQSFGPHVAVVNAAATDHVGTISLYGSRSEQEHSIVGDRRPVEVEARPLDRIIEQSGMSPDVVKIDVEGAENQVLRGGVQAIKDARIVLCEIHSELLAEQDEDIGFVERHLSKTGFSVKSHGQLTNETHMIIATKQT